MAKQIKKGIYQSWIYLQEEIITRGRREQIKTLKKRIKRKHREGKENKKLFLQYYQLRKTIGERRILANPYDENMTKKVAAFLKEWDAGVVPYAESWKLSYFNRIKHEMIKTLCEEFLTELKKKATKVCKAQNILSGHMT